MYTSVGPPFPIPPPHIKLSYNHLRALTNVHFTKRTKKIFELSFPEKKKLNFVFTIQPTNVTYRLSFLLDTFYEYKRRFGSDYTHIRVADSRFTDMKF